MTAHNGAYVVPRAAIGKKQYRYRETTYRISVRKVSAGDAAITVSVDGVLQSEPTIPLADDRADHRVEITVLNQKR